jgi:hypothetical protein
MGTVTTQHSPAREQLLARITLPASAVARRWEPFSPEAAAILRDWSESGEFERTLDAIHAESDDINDVKRDQTVDQ